MRLPFSITVKESITELRALQRSHGALVGKRMRMLIEIKKQENIGLSKQVLSDLTGINHNSIVKWRQMYVKHGIASLLAPPARKEAKKSIISPEIHLKIAQKLNDPQNGLQGYVELLHWVKTELLLDIKYITLLKYSQRHFGSKVKVARKSHAKKEQEAVDTFKKTLVKSVWK